MLFFFKIYKIGLLQLKSELQTNGPAAGGLNVEMFGNNHFFAFFNALDYVDEESSGCKSDTLLAFLPFKMASKMVDE